MKKICFLIIISILVLLFGGCASSMLQMKAAKALDDGRYDDAVSMYREVLKSSPEDTTVLNELGRTYILMKKGAEAVAVLEKSHKLDQNNNRTMVYLGLAYVVAEDYAKAINVWKEYVKRAPDSEVTRTINKQLTLIGYKDAAQWAKKAMQDEKNLASVSVNSDSIAVTYFGGTGASEQIQPLRKAMAAMIITDLSMVKSLNVIERIKLQKLLEEMQLGMSGLVSESTVPRIGRLLGAGKIVTGNMASQGDREMNVASVLNDVITGKEIGSQTAAGQIDEFFKIEKAIVYGTLKDMGIKLDVKEEELIGIYARSSYQALKLYGEALDAQDMGEWDMAINILEKCVSIDSKGVCVSALSSAPSRSDAAATPRELAYVIDKAEEAAEVKKAEKAAAAARGGGGGGGHH